MPDYVRTSGDLAHPFSSTLSDANGPVDLPEGTLVEFEMRLGMAQYPPQFVEPAPVGGIANVVSPGALVGDPNRGLVSYQPLAADVSTPGVYYAKWRVQYPDQPAGSVQSFPEASYETVILLPAV